jgi:NADPH-dependent F420 reductase
MSTRTNPETVAILGNGVVGVTLARGFAELGHPVIFGTRNANSEKTREALAAVPGARAATLAEAAAAGDLAVVALPWAGLKAGLQSIGAERLAGKVVIDASNPIVDAGGKLTVATLANESAGELVQQLLPGARVVKAFNIITATHMVHPHFPDGTPDMFIAGNDDGAKARVAEILQAFGWRAPIDMGSIEASRMLEALTLLWITYAVRNNHWTHGFSLLGRKG